MNPANTTITTDDLERDSVLAQRIRLFGWIRAKHLDVPEGEDSQGFLAFAEQGEWYQVDVDVNREHPS
jgi:Rab5 GDP/GTP exchange factor